MLDDSVPWCRDPFTVGHLVTCFPLEQLCALNLSSSNFPGGSMPHLARAKGLQSLDISNCPHITVESVSSFSGGHAARLQVHQSQAEARGKSCTPSCSATDAWWTDAGLCRLESLRMNDCANLVPSSSRHFAFVTGLQRLTELSWSASASAGSWMDPALHSGGGAISLLEHAAHLTGLKRCVHQRLPTPAATHPPILVHARTFKSSADQLTTHGGSMTDPCQEMAVSFMLWRRLCLKRQCLEPYHECMGHLRALSALTQLDMSETHGAPCPEDMNHDLAALAALTNLEALNLSDTDAAEGLGHFCSGMPVGAGFPVTERMHCFHATGDVRNSTND